MLEIGVGEQSGPVNHRLVLRLKSVVLPVHLCIRAIVLEEASVILRVARYLGIAKEVDELFAVFTDPGNLLRSVTMGVGVVFLC